MNDQSRKIRPLQELSVELERLKKEGKKIVHCHGVFDLLHPGHILHFQSARKEGDVLVVTMTPDRFVNKGPGRPVFNEQLRVHALASLECVDYVAINEWPTAVETIRLIKPDVYVKGPDYRDQKSDITGKIAEEEQAVLDNGGRLHITSDITFSSSSLLNEHFHLMDGAARGFIDGLKRIMTVDEVLAAVDALSSLKVLVVGDTIIDEYHYCKAMGMASKSATINARFINAEQHAGGALAVANHVAGFCKNVDLITCLGGKDEQRSFITSSLKGNIRPTFIVRDDAPTTVKRRFVDPFRIQKMFEVTAIADGPMPEETVKKILSSLSNVNDYDLVLIADFGHGMIGHEVADYLSASKAFLALNVQTNSANYGHNTVLKYGRGDFVSIDERELRLAYHNRHGNAADLAMRLKKDVKASMVALTLGEQGCLMAGKEGGTVQVPVFGRDVVDSVGAGDAFFSVAAPCAAKNYHPMLTGFIGNLAGAMAIRIVGNKEPVDPVQFRKFVVTVLK